MVKIVYDLPYETHKRFIESLTDFPHLQSMLHGRYIGFIENLKHSNKDEVKLLYQLCMSNMRSNTGKNCDYLMRTYGIASINELFSEKHRIKESRVNNLDEGEEWKIEMIKEITLVKRGLLENGLDLEVNKEFLKDICIN